MTTAPRMPISGERARHIVQGPATAGISDPNFSDMLAASILANRLRSGATIFLVLLCLAIALASIVQVIGFDPR